YNTKPKKISASILENFEWKFETGQIGVITEPIMYPGSRPNLTTISNMQGSINLENTTNFNLGNTTTHGGGRMALGGFSSAERMPAQVAVGNFCPHPAPHTGSDAEHMPYCGNGVGDFVENTFGRANQFTDGGRRSCKRKTLEGISGHPSYDGPSHSSNRQRSSSSRFTVPARHDMGSVSSFSGPAVTLASARHLEEPVVPRFGLIGGPNIAPDYRSGALSVTGTIEGSQRAVRNRPNPTYHQEQNLSHSRQTGNSVWHMHPRSSPVEQPNMDPAAINASTILRDQGHFPTSSVLRRRSLVPNERNENMPTSGTHFSFNAIGRGMPSLHSEASSSGMTPGVPNHRYSVSGADRRTSNNDSSSWVPTTRNLSGVPYTDQMSANPILGSRATGPWYPPQNLHMQIPRSNSGAAQGSISSSRFGQGNHLARASGPISFTPMNMAINTETGLQGPRYFRSSGMEHRGDCNVRPLARSILDISFERFPALQNEDERHNDLMSEDVLLFDQSAFYGAVDLHDRHRDMRLDVDNMTYEELLALEERIGNVSTGLTEESVSKCLKLTTYSSNTKSSAPDETLQKCSICQPIVDTNTQILGQQSQDILKTKIGENVGDIPRHLDADGDGKISWVELKTTLNFMGEDVGDNELREIVKQLDSDGDGCIDLEEFIRLINTEERGAEEAEKELVAAFRMFEGREGGGGITLVGLHRMMCRLGLADVDNCLTLDHCTFIISQVDQDGDGVVNLEEFKSVMMATIH
ncbi:hypothetical protein KI387_037971, partial [Taxus chinensis]